MAYDDSPGLSDRIMAALIAVIFAVPIGWGVGAITNYFGFYSPLFTWFTLLFFALNGFLRSRQSRDFLTQVWHGIVGVVRDLRLYLWP